MSGLECSRIWNLFVDYIRIFKYCFVINLNLLLRLVIMNLVLGLNVVIVFFLKIVLVFFII